VRASEPAGGTVAELLASWARALGADPWLDTWPAVLAVTPARSGRPCLLDGCGDALPLHPGTGDCWPLYALSGGGPLTVAGEWSPRGLWPLTAWDQTRAVPLGPPGRTWSPRALLVPNEPWFPRSGSLAAPAWMTPRRDPRHRTRLRNCSAGPRCRPPRGPARSPAVSQAAGRRLARMLGGEHLGLLDEWLTAAVARGLRPPEQ